MAFVCYSLMRIIPNILSASRGIAVLAMLFFPVFSPWFWALYCWGGISDMIDGPIARRLKAESRLGSKIDSAADFVFVICSAIMILPAFRLPVWIWLWTAAIGTVKLACIVIGSCRQRELAIPHSLSNKLTGVFLFCMPFAFNTAGVLIPAVIVCSAATLSLSEDIRHICSLTGRR